MYLLKYTRAAVFCGALLWLTVGILLLLRPAGNPPVTFRKSADLMPLLAIGLFLIGVATGLQLATYNKQGGKLFKIASRVLILSSLCYALGVIIRQVFLQATGWEPLMPLGFLGFIISWLVVAIICFKKKLLNRLSGLLMIISAISLFTFNDQYNPYGAVVFGTLSILLAVLSGLYTKQTFVPEKTI